MKGSCESGCGNAVKVYGCKWCPECYPTFSHGQSTGEKIFIVVAGKYEWDGEENVKYVSDAMSLKAAEEELKRFSGYHFSRIEHVDYHKR